MRLYKYVVTHPETKQRVTFWSHEGFQIKYYGNVHAELAWGLDKNQMAKIPDGTVQEIDVPADSAPKLASWLNEQSKDV